MWPEKKWLLKKYINLIWGKNNTALLEMMCTVIEMKNPSDLPSRHSWRGSRDGHGVTTEHRDVCLWLSFCLTLGPSLHVLFLLGLCCFLDSGGCLCTSSGISPGCWTWVDSATCLLCFEVPGWGAFSGYQQKSELVMSLSDQWVAGLNRPCGELPSSC